MDDKDIRSGINLRSTEPYIREEDDTINIGRPSLWADLFNSGHTTLKVTCGCGASFTVTNQPGKLLPMEVLSCPVCGKILSQTLDHIAKHGNLLGKPRP